MKNVRLQLPLNRGLEEPCPAISRNLRRGSALVIVLSSLAFLAALALAFLASVGTELKSSKRYADGITVRLLSQTTFNLANAQIKEATKGKDGTQTLAWASQAGLIRNFNDSGDPVKYYRLYSWDNLQGPGQFKADDEKTALNGWDTKTARFTDLNQPLSTSSGTVYPIVDGNGLEAVSGVDGLTYKLGNVQAVEGFSVNGIPTATSSTNPVPMPVQWLYVLQNGQVVPTTAGGSDKEAVVAAASSDNPIVGRVAFWTDDETCKVNLNTASEASLPGHYSDTPRVSTQFDMNLAKAPPYKNEFQRYGGHPATVSLSTVFRSLTKDPSFPENVYRLTPRTKEGGSVHGTVLQYGTTGAAPLTIKTDRLYASVDDFMFQPEVASALRLENNQYLTSDAKVTPAMLERAKFFATVSSRAPDLNLFNEPRVAMWPINSSTDNLHRTAYDKLIAFCSTLTSSKLPYYFQRSDSTSQTEWKDIPRNKVLLTYLRNLADKPIPGFGGGTFSSKYNATNTKGGAEIDQILMEIFDYIRATNLRDSSAGATFVRFAGTTNMVVPSYDDVKDVKGFGRFPTLGRAGILFIASGAGATTAVPAGVPQTLPGGGTGPAIPANNVRVQAALIFSLFDPSQGYAGIYPAIKFKVVSSTIKWTRGATGPAEFLFTGTPLIGASGSPGGDYSPWGGVLGSRLLTENYGNANDFYSSVPAASSDPAPYPDFPVGSNITLTGGDLKVQLLFGTTVVQTITLHFPDAAVPVPRMPTTPKVTITHTQAPLTSYISLTNFRDPSGAAPNYNYGRFNVGVNVNWTSSTVARYFINRFDTVKSLQSESGDLRLVAARATIDSGEEFQPHPFYADSTKTLAHGFTASNGEPYWGATRGQLVKGATAYNVAFVGSAPGLTTPFNCNDPFGTTQVSTSEPEAYGSTNHLAVGVMAGSSDSWSSGKPAGDFDNGTGSVKDGPYINKADEGTIQKTAGYPAYYGVGSGSNEIGEAFFTPNRQVPSPAVLGSLPTGVLGRKPWQTLLFHPDPTGLHAGAQTPPDHLLLDLFTMPVVDPYAISEPLSTAGRINMNYQVIPFTYINRSTGVRAVLKSQQILAVPNAKHGKAQAYGTTTDDYKQMVGQYNPTFSGVTYRFPVNLDETLKGFQARFDANDVFRSPSEICTLELIPNDTADSDAKYGTTMKAYWENHQLSGDNSRERPYANVYPLLTTKSNTYTVYIRVQTLKKISGDPTIWNESKDLVTGQYRGYQTIERYVDAAEPGLPDYASVASPTPISNFYKTRVLATKQFGP